MLLTALLDPSSGSIRVAGEELSRASLGRARRLLGYTFQDPDDQLFLSTVGEDVAFGPRNLGLEAAKVEELSRAAMDAVGVSHLADRAPDRLSGGEKRAAAIATVLAMEPKALLLDEPTAGLDPRSRRRLIGLLAGLDQTLLLASHDMDLVAELCERVIVLSGGKVFADGKAELILAEDSIMEAAGLERPASLRACARCGAPLGGKERT
jgi:cobalt/nickel transport system ATP-binding protein